MKRTIDSTSIKILLDTIYLLQNSIEIGAILIKEVYRCIA